VLPICYCDLEMKSKYNYLNCSEKLNCMAEKYLYQVSKIIRARRIRPKYLHRKELSEGKDIVQVLVGSLKK